MRHIKKITLPYTVVVVLFFSSLVIALFSVIQPDTESELFHAAGPCLLEIDIMQPIYYNNGGSPWQPVPGVRSWCRILDRAAADSTVRGILIRMNSPGGTMGATQELYQSVNRCREAGKTIVVSAVDLMASGAYYAALPAHRIFANESSLVGSVGVFMSAMEFSDLFEKLGITVNTIKSGENKDTFSMSRPMRSGERERLQEMVDQMHQVFFCTVCRWRTNDSIQVSSLRRYTDGRIMSGQQALERGFIDEIGDGMAARRYLAAACGFSPDDPPVRRSGKNGFWNNMAPLLSGTRLKVPALIEYRYRP